ncbi:MAG TPA: hypothetical protein VGP41_08535 [Candidatus Lustribacter sp.]|jgi:hypothetical protein|nr:hypothetical protein [Candidatus Lustribacter sp.]
MIAVQPEADELDVAIALLEQSKEKIKDLYEQIEEERAKQQWPRSAIWNLVGRDIVAKGNKSRTVGDYIVEAGYSETRFCACHATTNPGECDTEGDVVLITGAPKPYINVRRRSQGMANA